jgi:hypothetical protein
VAENTGQCRRAIDVAIQTDLKVKRRLRIILNALPTCAIAVTFAYMYIWTRWKILVRGGGRGVSVWGSESDD